MITAPINSRIGRVQVNAGDTVQGGGGGGDNTHVLTIVSTQLHRRRHRHADQYLKHADDAHS